MQNENLCIEDQSANLCVEDQSANQDIFISWKDKNNIQKFGIVKVPDNCDHNLIAQQVRQSINDEKFAERGITIINSEDVGVNNLEYFKRQIERHHLGKIGIISSGTGLLGISNRMLAEHHHPVEIINCANDADDLKATYMKNQAFDNPPISIRNYRNDFDEDLLQVQDWTEKLSPSKHQCFRNPKPRPKKKTYAKNKKKK